MAHDSAIALSDPNKASNPSIFYAQKKTVRRCAEKA